MLIKFDDARFQIYHRNMEQSIPTRLFETVTICQLLNINLRLNFFQFASVHCACEVRTAYTSCSAYLFSVQSIAVLGA